MKFSFVATLAMAVSVMSAAVPAMPQPIGTVMVMEKRQFESNGAILDTLKQAVVEQTTQINATLDGAPESPSTDEANSLADEINPRFAAIADALREATSSFQLRSLVARQEEDGEADSCDAQCITEKVLDIVYEIASTIRAAIERLGLRPLILQINPLLLALSALVISLNVLISGLLLTVSAVVTTLLGGLGLSLLLLGFIV
ncbi:hypothetical protein MGG_14388 [Pyricularia oryzae 70-15]|uniref:Uncharacterized protein n=1 Tax=Pyricularia oryzae (strain 70-15 / ATCC MYA-4617 / FGSC 8958) TaxID=242507 RepID=G4NBD3_PYRO7|nr:uncharacterized protein MGG_14388 [Pyricularia oryzae 70-15]EHA48092.1 hypothetical protein MGG_14388 [Pyricularia oryzae 70-15]